MHPKRDVDDVSAPSPATPAQHQRLSSLLQFPHDQALHNSQELLRPPRAEPPRGGDDAIFSGDAAARKPEDKGYSQIVGESPRHALDFPINTCGVQDGSGRSFLSEYPTDSTTEHLRLPEPKCNDKVCLPGTKYQPSLPDSCTC